MLPTKKKEKKNEKPPLLYIYAARRKGNFMPTDIQSAKYKDPEAKREKKREMMMSRRHATISITARVDRWNTCIYIWIRRERELLLRLEEYLFLFAKIRGLLDSCYISRGGERKTAVRSHAFESWNRVFNTSLYGWTERRWCWMGKCVRADLIHAAKNNCWQLTIVAP